MVASFRAVSSTRSDQRCVRHPAQCRPGGKDGHLRFRGFMPCVSPQHTTVYIHMIHVVHRLLFPLGTSILRCIYINTRTKFMGVAACVGATAGICGCWRPCTPTLPRRTFCSSSSKARRARSSGCGQRRPGSRPAGPRRRLAHRHGWWRLKRGNRHVAAATWPVNAPP